MGSSNPTWLVSSCLDNLQSRQQHQICFFQSDWPRCNLTLLLPAGCVTSPRTSFFSNLAAGRGLRGRKSNPFFGIQRCEEGRQLTDASLSVAAGAVGGLCWRFVLILHGKHLSEGPEACLALKSRVKVPFILTLPLFNLKLVSQRLWWRAAHWAHVSSHGNGCSAHCSRKVRQFSGFIFSLYRSRALAWHDPQIIWMPENPKPALYSFFVFYVPFLLGVEANKRMSFARIACLLGRFEKNKCNSDSSV